MSIFKSEDPTHSSCEGMVLSPRDKKTPTVQAEQGAFQGKQGEVYQQEKPAVASRRGLREEFSRFPQDFVPIRVLRTSC